MSLPRSYDKAHFIVFSNDAAPFRQNAETYCKEALAAGFDSATSYTQEALRETRFWADNAEILEQPRGAGYWLWKPYILLEKLREVGPNDVVVYNDVGRYKPGSFPMFPSFPHAALELCARLPKRFIHGFSTGWFAHSHYTKGDCLTLMDANNETIWRAPLVSACPLVYMPSEESFSFLERWLELACDPRILTDMEDQVGAPHPYFLDHRHDQAIASILVHQTKAHHIDISKETGIFRVARDLWNQHPDMPRPHTHISYFSTIVENALPDGLLANSDAGFEGCGKIIRNLSPEDKIYQFNLKRPIRLDRNAVMKMIAEGDIRPTKAQIRTLFAGRYHVFPAHLHQLRKMKNIDQFWDLVESDLQERCKDMPIDSHFWHVGERAIESARAAYDEFPEIRDQVLKRLVWSYMSPDLRDLLKEARSQADLPSRHDIIAEYLEDEGRVLLMDEAEMKAHSAEPLRAKVGEGIRRRIMAYIEAASATEGDATETDGGAPAGGAELPTARLGPEPA